MTILLWNLTENGQFVPGTAPGSSQGRVSFVPRTVPVCPEHRPAKNVYVYWFFLARPSSSKISGCVEDARWMFLLEPSENHFVLHDCALNLRDELGICIINNFTDNLRRHTYKPNIQEVLVQ